MKHMMKYTYLVILLLILVGMFYIGEKMPGSQNLTYSTAPDRPLSATLTKDDYCAPEVDAESAKSNLELSQANSKISELERELEVLRTIVSGTPTPTPTSEVTSSVSPTPTAVQPTVEEKKASSSAKE